MSESFFYAVSISTLLARVQNAECILFSLLSYTVLNYLGRTVFSICVVNGRCMNLHMWCHINGVYASFLAVIILVNSREILLSCVAWYRLIHRYSSVFAPLLGNLWITDAVQCKTNSLTVWAAIARHYCIQNWLCVVFFLLCIINGTVHMYCADIVHCVFHRTAHRKWSINALI